ncbi:MAG: NTP transferase domain-containing protein, partial [Victivallales bacterium]|nr:NTP transferase domain-containing protein [Victivallales bacterium]
MSNNIAGFILAAGEGRRLRPATLTRPKALVPFCGVPLLELVASYLNELGLKQTIVNASYQGERVFEACQRLNEAHGWNLHVSCEPKLLNQGGGIRYGVRLLPDVDTFLIHNVDILLDYDLHELIDQHFQNQADVTVLLIPGRGPRTVSLTGEGQINRFRDP